MEGPDQPDSQAPASPVSSASPEPSAPSELPTPSASPAGPSISPAPSHQPPATPSPQPSAAPADSVRSTKRPVIIIVVLFLAAVAVVGLVIYFALSVTGVIETWTNSSSEDIDSSGSVEIDPLEELYSRIYLLQEEDVEDSTLEQDLKDYLDKMLDEHGKDSDEVSSVATAIALYYNTIGDHDGLANVLNELISNSDSDSAKVKYLTLLYDSVSNPENYDGIAGDAEAQQRYLDEINSMMDSIADNEAKVKAMLDVVESLLNIYYTNSDMSESSKSLLLEYARSAEELYPSAETAIFLYTIEREFGSEEMSEHYHKLAMERDPEKYGEGKEIEDAG